jgi:hypothetical protein
MALSPRGILKRMTVSMKNDEGVALPLELERRLKLAVDRLGQVRQTLEELDRNADAIRPLLGVRLPRGRGRAAASAGPAMKSTAGRPAAAPPPVKETRGQPSNTAPAQAAQEDEIPEWRKLFPGLSAQHPKRK